MPETIITPAEIRALTGHSIDTIKHAAQRYHWERLRPGCYYPDRGPHSPNWYIATVLERKKQNISPRTRLT